MPTVPGHIIGLSITVDGAVGARGGTTSFENGGGPGNGAQVSGYLPVTPGNAYYVYAGGQNGVGGGGAGGSSGGGCCYRHGGAGGDLAGFPRKTRLILLIPSWSPVVAEGVAVQVSSLERGEVLVAEAISHPGTTEAREATVAAVGYGWHPVDNATGGAGGSGQGAGGAGGNGADQSGAGGGGAASSGNPVVGAVEGRLPYLQRLA